MNDSIAKTEPYVPTRKYKALYEIIRKCDSYNKKIYVIEALFGFSGTRVY